jgi:hypothetical protein
MKAAELTPGMEIWLRSAEGDARRVTVTRVGRSKAQVKFLKTGKLAVVALARLVPHPMH